MMPVFISFIGKGKPDKDGRYKYERVTYSFKRTSVETSCFANAVMLSREFSFDRVRIIGTVSSSWDQLLEDPDGEEEDLYLELSEASPEKLYSLRPNLIEALKKRWHVPDVDLLIHPAELTGNEDHVLETYLKLMLDNEGEIVLDVTHSFRWMPQFLASATQLADALSAPRQVRILYGEFSPGKPCPVRVLDPLWDARQLAMDIKMFFEKWEAEPLACRLDSIWPSGARALRKIGSHLQGNYLVPLVWDKDSGSCGLPLRQLNNALTELEEIRDVPLWLTTVKKKLRMFVNDLSHPATPSERLLRLSSLYADRSLYGQALLCQEIALRIFLWEKYGQGGFPDWDALGEAMNQYLEKEKPQPQFWHILTNRNTVAHGALRSRGKCGGIPQIGNIKPQYQAQNEYLKRLFGGRN